MPPATAAGNARHYTTRASLFKRFSGIMTEEPATGAGRMQPACGAEYPCHPAVRVLEFPHVNT